LVGVDEVLEEVKVDVETLLGLISLKANTILLGLLRRGALRAVVNSGKLVAHVADLGWRQDPAEGRRLTFRAGGVAVTDGRCTLPPTSGSESFDRCRRGGLLRCIAAIRLHVAIAFIGIWGIGFSPLVAA
jgi:hypothetical protein